MLPTNGHLIAGIAQVILSVRDPDEWYDSYVASLLWLYSTWWFKPFSWCLPMGWKLQVTCYSNPLTHQRVQFSCTGVDKLPGKCSVLHARPLADLLPNLAVERRRLELEEFLPK